MIALAALLKLDLIHHRKKKRRDKAGRRTPPALTPPATVLVEKLNRIFQTSTSIQNSLPCVRPQEGIVDVRPDRSSSFLLYITCLVALASTIATSHAQVSRSSLHASRVLLRLLSLLFTTATFATTILPFPSLLVVGSKNTLVAT